MFPTVAGAEAIVVNLKDADGNAITTPIKFPIGSIADIYLGKITKWNDPVLTAANPDIKLPAQDIIVVHRSDGSGTTYIFTDYLSKVSPEWKSTVGNSSSVQWPVGLGGKGNEGVYGTVSQNDGSIGYVEPGLCHPEQGCHQPAPKRFRRVRGSFRRVDPVCNQ